MAVHFISLQNLTTMAVWTKLLNGYCKARKIDLYGKKKL